MRVISCIVSDHNLWLVLLAALVCITGCYVTMRLLDRALRTDGLQRSGWIFQAASAAGSSVWCTHFVAILAYDPHASVTFDPMLTIASLAIAICGFAAGFAIAARWTAIASGTIIGLTIALMHYVGMAAYHITGIVEWDVAFVAASLPFSIVLSIVALHAIARTGWKHGVPIATM